MIGTVGVAKQLDMTKVKMTDLTSPLEIPWIASLTTFL